MTVSIQQASANAFAGWLGDLLTGVVVEPRWPNPDKQKSGKVVTIITAGPRRDTPIDLRQIKFVNDDTDVEAPKVVTTWQLAACNQPVQLDVWALSDIDRDDILARLDIYTHMSQVTTGWANPVGVGSLVAVQDGWEDCGTIADFVFEEPDLETTSDSVGRSIYRATLRGNAYMMLTVTSSTARQAVIKFNERVSETDSPLDFGTYTTEPT